MASGVPGTKRKNSFVEENMLGSYDLLCGKIKSAIAFVRRGVAQKDARNWVWWEFMGGSRWSVWVAEGSKNTKMIITGWLVEELVVWCRVGCGAVQ
jgi:hypothetical protein